MPTKAKVVLFTGAGVGVPLGLPTSTEFVVEMDANARQITKHVRAYLGKDADDIEWVLSGLEEFRTQTDFTEYLLPHLAAGNSHAEHGKAHVQRSLTSFRKEGAQELVRLKKVIFEKLNSYDAAQAVQVHAGLIRSIREAVDGCALSVFTTNYDLTFEAAAENGEAVFGELGIAEIDYGFSMTFGRPIYDPSRDFKWQPTIIEYLKLHGSLDWHRDAQGRCSRSMSSTVPDDPDQMAILYPGFKGVPEAEPFISMHGRLNRRLAEADIVVVVGFAFRDSYINALFENVLRLRRDLKVLYFNPLPLDKHPSGSVAPRLSSAYAAFAHNGTPLSLNGRPLPIGELLRTWGASESELAPGAEVAGH